MNPADYHNILAAYSNQFGGFIQNIFSLMKNESGWLSQYFSYPFPSIQQIYSKYFQPDGEADYHNILVTYSCQFGGFIQNIFRLMENASGWLSQYFSYLFSSIRQIYSKHFQPNEASSWLSQHFGYLFPSIWRIYFQPDGEYIYLIITIFWLYIHVNSVCLFKIFSA